MDGQNACAVQDFVEVIELDLQERTFRTIARVLSWNAGRPISPERMRRRIRVLLAGSMLVVGALIQGFAVLVGVPGYVWPLDIGFIVAAVVLFRTIP